MSLHAHTAFQPDRLPLDERVAVRRPIHLPVFLIAPGGEPISATMVDVSTHGFRVRSGYPPTLGRFLAVDVPAFARYSGWVAWAQMAEFGFDVANPLPETVVNHILHLADVD
ncbi:PilZ domain-containing protein [Sphingomonas faeni]|uniref:PilZ domain-containing protein n=1 Tax=Sphingomonas TaxID=13687 RepID=UPI0033650D73|nr:PilZ domain-containing protein [Sphingomonas faeni]